MNKKILDVVPPRFSFVTLGKYNPFPRSTKDSEGIITIERENDEISYGIYDDTVYATKDGMNLRLFTIEPELSDDRLFPVIAFVQGSGWMKQTLGLELPQLLKMAKKGYVIAVIEYRPSEIASFPAQICDTKTALRFLKRHARHYKGDPNKIILWGDSSGGHTAIMAAATLNDDIFTDEDVNVYPLDIKALIDYYGVTDISKIKDKPTDIDHESENCMEALFMGGFKNYQNQDLINKTIPMNYISEDKAFAPTLIFHGDMDFAVPFGQSVLLYEDLKRKNKEVMMYRLKDAVHGGAPFWDDNIIDIIDKFIKEQL